MRNVIILITLIAFSIMLHSCFSNSGKKSELERQDPLSIEETKAFFIDLAPFLGSGEIMHITKNGNALTGYKYFAGNKDNVFDDVIEGFVWTKDSGYKILETPDGCRDPMGIYVSNDGKIVAGIVADASAEKSDQVNNIYFTEHIGIAVWGQSEKPVSTIRFGIPGAWISGMSADGSIVVGNSTLTTVDDRNALGGFSIINGKVEPISSLDNLPANEIISSLVEGISPDGKRLIVGDSYAGKMITMDFEGNNRERYLMEGKVQSKFNHGDYLADVKMFPGFLNDKIRINALSYDGSTALGSFEVEPYDKIKYGSSAQRFIFVQDKDSVSIIAGAESSGLIFPLSISHDGDIALLSFQKKALIWTSKNGLMSLEEVFRKYNIDSGSGKTYDVRRLSMSSDGKCITGQMNFSTSREDDYHPFVACFEDLSDLNIFLSDSCQLKNK